MVNKELIEQVIRQAVDRVHDNDKQASPFQLQLVHQLLDEMSGALPHGTTETTVTNAIRQESIARVRRNRGLPLQR